MITLKFALPKEGQGLVEYGLIIVIVAVLVIVLLWLFGNQVGDIYSNIVDVI